jgi:hypothetical protein
MKKESELLIDYLNALKLFNVKVKMVKGETIVELKSTYQTSGFGNNIDDYTEPHDEVILVGNNWNIQYLNATLLKAIHSCKMHAKYLNDVKEFGSISSIINDFNKTNDDN